MTVRLVLDDLYRLRSVGDPQLSPDARRVAFTITGADRDEDRNATSIWVVPADGSAEPARLTRGHADSSPRWSPDGRFLAFLSVRGSEERAQIWLLPVAGGEPHKLTSRPTGVSGFVWSPDGSRIAFTSSVSLAGDPPDDASDDDERKRRAAEPVVVERLGFKADGAGLLRGRRTHLFAQPVEDGDPVQLTQGDWSASWPAWSPDASTLVFSAATDPDADLEPDAALYAVPVSGGSPVRLTGEDTRQVAAPAFTASGTTIVFAGKLTRGVGHTRLLSVPAAGGDVVRVAPGFDRNVMVGAPGYPGARPSVLPDGTVLFCARDRGCTRLYAVTVTGGDPLRVAGSQDTSLSGLSVSGDSIAMVVAGKTTSGEVVVAGRDGTGQRTVTQLGGIDDVDLFCSEERTFTAPDGAEIHGWVLRDPSVPAPGPLLLDVHGGPHNAWGPTIDTVHLYHQTLVAEGWTVLTINSRGSDGYGEAFYSALTGAWGEADLGDFMSAVDTLVDAGVADPRRLCVAGYSYGGYMSNWITAHTGRFAAAITGGCLSDLSSFYGTSDVGRHLNVHEIGADPDTVRRLSPIAYVDHVTTPTLILHGENDDRCPISQGEQWFAALRMRRLPVAMVRYPGASHLFILNGRPSHRIDYNRRIHEWAVRHCVGADVAVPVAGS